jgi:glycosyltransferase involved in cell wall biosynthesis
VTATALEAIFVFPNPRGELAAEVRAGSAPDTGLMGQNHLDQFGIRARVVEPALPHRQREHGVLHRLTWNLREVTLPWEARDATVAITPLANLFPLTARLRGRPRVVLLNYGLMTVWRRASRTRRAALRASLRTAASVVCLSSAQRNRLVEDTGLDASRVRVAPFGVDERFFTPTAPPDDGHVLAVGKDLARDYATLAAAARGLAARVVIVGLPRNFSGLTPPANVELRSGVSWLELRDLYAGAACVVLPLRRPEYPYGTEASGLTALLEAMASRRPIVVTQREAFADYVTPEESCLTAEPEDPQSLRTAIERVLAERALAEDIGERCRALVEHRFTTRHFAERLATVLREVARA